MARFAVDVANEARVNRDASKARTLREQRLALKMWNGPGQTSEVGTRMAVLFENVVESGKRREFGWVSVEYGRIDLSIGVVGSECEPAIGAVEGDALAIDRTVALGVPGCAVPKRNNRAARRLSSI